MRTQVFIDAKVGSHHSFLPHTHGLYCSSPTCRYSIFSSSIMKRGFLNSKKGKAAIASDGESPAWLSLQSSHEPL